MTKAAKAFDLIYNYCVCLGPNAIYGQTNYTCILPIGVLSWTVEPTIKYSFYVLTVKYTIVLFYTLYILL